MMKRKKPGMSSISKARSYSAIGEFWDEHSLSEFWEQTRRIKVSKVRISSKRPARKRAS